MLDDWLVDMMHHAHLHGEKRRHAKNQFLCSMDVNQSKIEGTTSMGKGRLNRAVAPSC